jgi:glyoxylase-like metal-dependent hydrolase (beta-lactamase superfamily II)
MPASDEAALHFPLGEALPAPGRTLEVAPGVRWLRMRLPFALDHIHLWLLRDELDGVPGWTVVDCGIADEDTRAAWRQILAQELRGLPVLRVLVTHMHPDHIGLAHWLTRRFSRLREPGDPPVQDLGPPAAVDDCRMWISGTDFNAARIASRSTTGHGGEAAARFFAAHGLVDPQALAKVRARGSYYASMVPQVPERYRRLMDGQRLSIGGQTWECLAGYGHAPEHIALHCAALGVLISGDMVLPRISTNVSVIDLEPEADPLPLYLDSLQRLLALPQDTLVLPSHGRPFVGLHTRIGQLRAHHEARLHEVMQACSGRPCSAAELLPVLFRRPLDLHQTTFAMGEAVAHLHMLLGQGRLQRRLGPDGVIRFVADGETAGA